MFQVITSITILVLPVMQAILHLLLVLMLQQLCLVQVDITIIVETVLPAPLSILPGSLVPIVPRLKVVLQDTTSALTTVHFAVTPITSHSPARMIVTT